MPTELNQADPCLLACYSLKKAETVMRKVETEEVNLVIVSGATLTPMGSEGAVAEVVPQNEAAHWQGGPSPWMPHEENLGLVIRIRTCLVARNDACEGDATPTVLIIEIINDSIEFYFIVIQSLIFFSFPRVTTLRRTPSHLITI